MLGRIGDARAVEPLRRSLNNPNLRLLAIIALGEIGPPSRPAVSDLSRIVRESRSNGDSESTEAVEAIGKIGFGSTDAIDVLCFRMTRARDGGAAHSLSKLGEAGVDKLLSLAEAYAGDSRPENEKKYGEAYAQLVNGGPLPVEMITLLAKCVERGDRRGFIASLALANIGAPAKASLISLLENPDRQVRKDAAYALARMNHHAQAARTFRNEDVEDPVRLPEVLPKLVALARNDDGKVEWEVIQSILGIDSESALQNPQVKELIAEALERRAR